jgi:hypothetical protein
MDIATLIAEIAKDLLIFIGAMVVLFVVLIAIIANLPAGNPAKRILVALCYRVAAMLGAGIIAIPVEPIPGIDVVYDAAAAIALVIYWITFFTTAAKILSGSEKKPPRGTT